MSLEELEERVERIEKSLNMESDWYDENDDWHEDDGDSSPTTRESKDSTDWVEAGNVGWDADTMSVYRSEDVCDGGKLCEYLVAADEVRDGIHITWSPDTQSDVNSDIVTEDIGRWVSEQFIDDDVVDKYLVEPESDWRETFEDLFNYGGVEVTEIADTPAVVEKHDYLPTGSMNEIHKAGWRVKCVHSSDHDSAHPEVREADGMVIRFTEIND